MRNTMCRTLGLILVVFLAATTARAGTTYVDFDDATRGPLTTGGPLKAAPFNYTTGVVTFGNGQAYLNCTAASQYGPFTFAFSGYVGYGGDPWNGADQTEQNGVSFAVPVTMEFTAPIPSELTGLHTGALGPGVFAIWHRTGAGSSDRGCGIINDAGTIKVAIFNGTGVIQGSPAIAEALPPGASRVSIKMVRTATTIELLAAYNENATTPGHPGTFHSISSVARTGTAAAVQIYGADANTPGGVWGVHIDDLIVSGDTIPDFPPPPLSEDFIRSNLTPGFIEEGMRLVLTAPDGTDYQWKDEEGSIPGENQQTLVFDPVAIADGGSYTCVYNNAKGVVETAPFVFEVLPQGSLPVGGAAALGIVGIALIVRGLASLRRKG